MIPKDARVRSRSLPHLGTGTVAGPQRIDGIGQPAPPDRYFVVWYVGDRQMELIHERDDLEVE